MGGEFFTDFKSLNRIEISWLLQVLSNFNWFWGSHLGVADGWMGWGWVWVCMGVSYAHTHAHTCTRTYAHLHMHVKHAKHGCFRVSGHLQFLYMYTCACVHVHACMCVGGHPTMPPNVPRHPHLPPPKSHREPKTAKFNKSWTNRDNSILFEDSSPLNNQSWTHIDYSWSPQTPPHPPAPPPRAKETQIRRITISLEWIEIIQFCLKICDPWTLLHTYRLGLMCRWGGCPIPNGTFMFLIQKSAPVTLQ